MKGEVLDICVAGPKGGVPLVFHHGTPGSRLLFQPFIEAVVTRGLRYVSYSRPGYGDSTRRPGRTVAECSKSVGIIMDELGADRFYAIGWSGGGPHALACAALLPKRVIAASTIAGVAPFEAQGLDFLAGMGKENIEEFHAALAGPDELRLFLESAAPAFAHVTGDQITASFGDLIDDVDRAALTGGFSNFLAENMRQALRSGFWGWFDDDVEFTSNWSFDLSRIVVPVSVWQGAKDRMVPFAHGHWLSERIPGAQAHLLPDQGHLSLAVGHFNQILDDMIEIGKQ